MNLEATVVLFDGITKRKEYLSQRIESCLHILKQLTGNERKEILIEVDLYRSEEKWLTQLQLDLMRALLTGGK